VTHRIAGPARSGNEATRSDRDHLVRRLVDSAFNCTPSLRLGHVTSGSINWLVISRRAAILL
jgi:hypothetical protein